MLQPSGAFSVSSIARLEAVENFVAGDRRFFQRFVTLNHALAVGGGRIGVAIQNAGVKFGAVFAGEFGGFRAVARVVAHRFQTLHVGLVRLELLFFHAVGDAR